MQSPPSSGGAVKKATRFTVTDHPNTAHVDDISDDSVAAETVNGGADPTTKGLERKSSFGSSSISRFKQVSKELTHLASVTRRFQPVGKPDPGKSAAAQALKGLKFISNTDADAWVKVEREFDELTKLTNGLLPRSRFGECIGMNKVEDKDNDRLFAGELFDALCRRRRISGGSITKSMMRDFWDTISDHTFDTRLHIFFDMVDKDGDGRITEDEIKDIIASSASTNHLPNIQKQAGEYARLIMEELDTDDFGYIRIENLEMLLRGPEQSTQGESQKLNKLLSLNTKRTAKDHPLIKWYKDLHYFLQDNWKRVWVMALWMGAMGGLFAYKYVEYKNKEAFEVMGHCVCMAKGAAETLKLNMALILLPMCRNTITWLRNHTRLGAAVPFDDNINFHQVIAVAIGIGVGIHGISHLACDFPRLLNADPEKYEPMEKFFGDQPTSYWYFVKGWEGVTGIIMVVLMAIAFTLASPWFRNNNDKKGKKPKPKEPSKPKKYEALRKKLTEFNAFWYAKKEALMKKLTGFNAFWYTHHLFIIVYTLLIIHGIKLYLTQDWYKKTTWMYLTIPMVIYAGERLTRAFKPSIKPVNILKVGIHRDLVELHMSKPQGLFKYKSGQYIFVNCAAVSPFEWHPFSLTSAPKDEYLSVHIRARGDWTNKFKKVYTRECRPQSAGESGSQRAENNPSIPKVKIDGPYGAPTQDYKNYDIVLLIGLGIGATPMISVLKDIANNMKEMEDLEKGKAENEPSPQPQSLVSTRKTSPKHDFKTRRAYFYWSTRDQDSFDWFKDVMNNVAEMDHTGAIEMHNYCTSVYEEGDARSALISMLQTIKHAKNGVDIVTGTKVKSHFARPNWREVYKKIAINHPHSTVGVFYCGARSLVKELRTLASDFSQINNTKFEFHKENF